MDEGASTAVGSDQEIVARVLAGDARAYGVLVERYEQAVLSAALPVLRDLHAAQDVVQETFVQCFLKLHTLRDGSRYAYWLMKSARREAIRAARRRRRDAPGELRLSAVGSTDAAIVLDDEKQQLLETVQALPAHERLAVTLRYFQGHSVAEIARMTGRPIGTVTKRLSRAIARLRAALTNEDKPCPMNK